MPQYGAPARQYDTSRDSVFQLSVMAISSRSIFFFWPKEFKWYVVLCEAKYQRYRGFCGLGICVQCQPASQHLAWKCYSNSPTEFMIQEFNSQKRGQLGTYETKRS